LANIFVFVAEVFARGRVLDDVAAEWIAKYKEEADTAVADLFTFVLRCAGCDYKVGNDVVTDPDAFKDRVSDIQERYQAVGVP
jgi:cohesin complex subunit SA-1/2